MVMGFMSLPDEHAPSAKSRIRRVLHAQRTDPMKPPRSAPPAGVDLHLLPERGSSCCRSRTSTLRTCATCSSRPTGLP
jgi:hypothetical protein